MNMVVDGSVHCDTLYANVIPGGGGGAETNSLETVCTGILTGEVPLGSGSGVATYTATTGTGNILRASKLPTLSKSITVEDPTGAEDISMFFTSVAITVTEIRAVLVGGGASRSVTWTVRHGTDRSATGAEAVTGGTATTSLTSGSDVTSFNDATIVADSFVWIETTAMVDDPGEISLTIVYTED